MANISLPADAFGDRFDLNTLPLPRPAVGYAVQMLDTDKLLDRQSGDFLSVRATALQPLFESFDAAYADAKQWMEKHSTDPDEHRLAIIPAGYDAILNRHILIYGVLCGQP
ncbi:MAG: hypothetical protein H6R13_3819 [Proteobacteria bacterium]|nr:hypothetical protein [Pseudomonadota bacterium]